MGAPAAAAAGSKSQFQARTVPGIPPEAGQWHRVRGTLVEDQWVAPGATLTVKVTGKAGMPASGVTSVAFDIATTGRTNSGQVIAYPSDMPLPSNTTTIRYPEDFDTFNLVFLKVGADGNIKLTNNSASDVRIYAFARGYTASTAGTTAGSTFVPLTPARLGSVNVPASGTAHFAPLGKAGVPSAGVSDVLFTMSTRSSGAGHLAVYPSGTSVPGDNNLEYGQGLLVQNQVFGTPGADGKINITNRHPYAVTVYVDINGYFAEPTAAVKGATVHPVNPVRVVNNVTVPANGTHTVAPLGHGGVPTGGVTGVYINLTNTPNTTGNGVLRVFPSGTESTGTHALTWASGKGAYSGGLPAKLGADRKITVLNSSSYPVRLYVDVFAYFKAPTTGCTTAAAPAVAKAGAKAVADPEPYNPTTVLQASPAAVGSQGTLEFAYTDGIGRLMHGRADPSALGSLQWTPIHGQEGYYGQPALGEQGDGRLNILAHNLSGDVWSRTQATKEPAAWADWVDLEQPMGSTVTVARQDDALVAFAVDGSGSLWALPQYAANDPYKGWIELGVTGVSTATAPLAAPVADGLRLFFLDASGTWRTAMYARGTVSDCAALSGPGFSGNASVVSYPGSRLRIFVRGIDGHVLTKMQDGSGAFPQDWDQVGDLVAAGSPSALVSPRSGKTEVVVRGTDERVHSTGETVQGTGQWRAWVDAQPDASVPATDPTAFQYVGPNGPTWSYVFRTVNQEMRLYWPEGESLRSKAASPVFKGRALPKPPPAR